MKARPSNDIEIWRKRWAEWRTYAGLCAERVNSAGWIHAYQRVRRREMDATNGK